MRAGKTTADPPTVVCTQTACPAGYSNCTGFCVLPHISQFGLKADEICAAFAGVRGSNAACATAASGSCVRG